MTPLFTVTGLEVVGQEQAGVPELVPAVRAASAAGRRARPASAGQGLQQPQM